MKRTAARIGMHLTLLAAAVGSFALAAGETSEPIAVAGDTQAIQNGEVREWLLLVGLPNSVNPKALEYTRDSKFREYIVGETQWQPREGYALKSEKVLATTPLLWKRPARSVSQVVLAEHGGKKGAVSYLIAYLVTPEATDAFLEPNAGKNKHWVLVNGTSQDLRKPVRLNAGYNTVLVRIYDEDGAGAFSLKVTGKDRKPIPELRSALRPTEETEGRRAQSALEADPAFNLFPKPTERQSYLLDSMTPQAKAILDKALACMLKSQQANGAWSDTNYPESVGVTALCCMALLAEGSLPRQGAHGKALDKGIEFLINSFREDGTCASKTVEGYGVMYGHALATLVLLEAGGNMPWYSDVEGTISKALQVLLRYQRADGGWRYELTQTGESDTSVTTLVLWVLGEARRCGYTVPKSQIAKALQYIESCGLPDGRFSYRAKGEAKIQPHSGVGVAALYGAGRIDHPLLPAARELIVFEYQRYSAEDLSQRRYLLFGSFFASLSIYSSGHKTWCDWYAKLVEVLAKLQGADGEIPDQAGNKVYTTALAAIMLQAPNGYLSIYQQ